MGGFELPPGRWQAQLTILECKVQYMLGTGARPSRAGGVLEHATALRVLCISDEYDEPTQPELYALLGTLAALPALERVEVARSELQREVQQAHAALGRLLERLHSA